MQFHPQCWIMIWYIQNIMHITSDSHTYYVCKCLLHHLDYGCVLVVGFLQVVGTPCAHNIIANDASQI